MCMQHTLRHSHATHCRCGMHSEARTSKLNALCYCLAVRIPFNREHGKFHYTLCIPSVNGRAKAVNLIDTPLGKERLQQEQE